MSSFKPVIFRTTSGYRFTVTCLHDVIKVMAMGWPNKDCDKYLEAARLTERAKEGWGTPRAAYEAFVAAAREQGRIVGRRKLRGPVAEALASIEPEAFNPSVPELARRQRRRNRVRSSASTHPIMLPLK